MNPALKLDPKSRTLLDTLATGVADEEKLLGDDAEANREALWDLESLGLVRVSTRWYLTDNGRERLSEEGA